MIKVFTTNDKGKIELTKDELKALLDEAYWDGYRANGHYIYTTPTWPWTGTPIITCTGTDKTGATIATGINADEFKVGTIMSTCEIEFGVEK